VSDFLVVLSNGKSNILNLNNEINTPYGKRTVENIIRNALPIADEGFDRNEIRYTKHNYINRFANGIIDDETAYWFGFLCADGSVSKYSVSISLASYDFKHLIKIPLFFEDLQYYLYMRNRSNSRSIVYTVNSREIANNLVKLGIPYNKNKNDIDLSFVSDNLFRHFVRGYFDGDGSVSVYNYKGLRICVGFRGQYQVLDRIQRHLNENIELSNVKIAKDGNSHNLCFRSRQNVFDLLYYLYDKTELFLERKRLKFERFKYGEKYIFDQTHRKGYENYLFVKSVKKR